MELSHHVKKIGHSLVEIRVRALKSIISKLDHSLVSVSDLVQERRLFVVLLEWFNFPTVPMQDEVLELLNTLSQHPGAAQMLRDVGAVEFLTQLSPNMEPRLRGVIDSILDQLFLLPELIPRHTTVYSHGQHIVAPTVPPVAPLEEHSIKMGFFQKTKQSNAEVLPQRIAVPESVRCLKFSMFPWLALTTTDRHILSSNESSLRSNNPNLVQTTCELLRDVIMQDFPVEIFLQRPGIVQSLLSLLRLSSGEGEKRCLRLQALSCLQQLCVCLRSRLRFHQDPGFRSSKQDPVSQNSSLSYSQEGQGAQRSLASSPGAECSPRPSVVGRTGQRARGDGQDGDAPSNSGSSHRGSGAAAQDARRPLQSPAPDGTHLELPDLGAEDVVELQLRQLSLAQFTLATMEHAIPLLKTEGTRVVHRVLDLLCKAVLLLGDCVNELVWDDRSLVGKELKEKLQVCLELLGDILSYHQRGSSDGPPQSAVVHHRLAYTGSAVFAVRLLQAIVPPEKASDNIPDGMAKAIFSLSLDSALAAAYPGVQESAAAYLEQVNPDGHDLYRRVTRASLCMESTCSFLKETQAQGEKNWLELLELADQAVDGLPYHQHLPVIKECVHLCSYLWKLDEPRPLLQTESQRVFLKLLSHPLLPVKTETYSCTLNLVKECLGIQNACRLASSVCCGVHFLLHHRVLYEISAFGLQDSADKVNAAAKDILLFLIKGRLMMTASTWDRFNEAVYPVIPVLQGYAGTEDSLGNCVLLLSEVSDVRGDDVFPITCKVRAALRLLFTKKPTVRIAAVQDIVPHLTSAERSHVARPVLNQAVLDSLPSLFCLKQTLDIRLDTIKNSFLKVESVERLFGILTSDTVDVSLRRSSAEQLAVVLQDTAMHPVLKNLGITDKVIFFILESINGSESSDCLLEPCLCILRKLVYADPSLRHSLAQNTPLLLMLLRASLLLKENKVNVSEAAALMCFLLFDEIATVDVWTDTSCSDVAVAPFSLPLSIVRRYNFPFQAAGHHAVSPYCCVLPPSSDLLSLAPARHALQVAWNTAWHSGIDGLLEERRGIRDKITEFHDDLTLSETQLLSLRASHRPAGLQDCVQAIVTAVGHCSVTSALSRLRLYLLTDRVALLPRGHAPHSCRSALRSLAWQRAFTRFLQVRPACLEDERLMADIVAFLNAYFQQGYTDPLSDQATDDLRWILELILNHETASLLDLLLGVESQAGPGQSPMEPEELRSQVSQRLQRELTSFFNTLLRCLERTTDRLSLALAGPFRSQLAVRLLQCLRVSDAPRFYGLPSLERTLLGMVTLTARPGWSVHCPELDSMALCCKYLSGLLEVISSFYVEWGGNAMSFMGKGVTKNAVICLLHLSHEMKAESKDNDFISQWSLGQEAGSEETSASPMGLAWLIPLWVDRDAEVRFSSLGVASALSSVPSGCQGLSASCQNISGGLWGTLLNMLLDQQECSMVRREAAFILQNLLVMPMPASAEEAKDSHWQNPCVHDEVSGVSLVGLPALQALLYHCQYFQHVALSASACYLGRYIFHLQPAASTTTRGPSPQESTSGDSENSLRYWTSAAPATAVNTSRASSSLSTSSTVLGASGPHTPVALSPLGNVGAHDTPASRLMTQGQSDTDTSDSVISQDSRRGRGGEPSAAAAELVVAVTPDLLAAHCGLLGNLTLVLPDFTLDAVRHSGLLHSLASLVDAGPIEKCLSELKNPNTSAGEREDIKIQVFTLLRYMSSFSKFLQTCVTANQEFIGQMEFLRPLLANGVTVLTMDTDNLVAEAQAAVCMCWADVFTLLATLVRRDCSAVHPSVSAALGRRWQAFAGTLSVCVSERLGDPHLHTVALQFLCVLLFKETKRHIVEVTGLTSEPVTPLSDILNGPPAGHLCELLLQSFERRSSQDPLKRLTARAMMAVLACSRPAQTHAARAGLIDSCVEQMKQSQSHLYRESVRPGKAANRKKDESYLREVKMMAEILRNALYRNDDCKVAATDARLTQVLHALWPWLLLDDTTMEAVLELLCVYTANCTAACSSLCCGSGTGVAPGCRGPPSSTLMHCVMKLTSGLAADNSPVQKLAFSLLANLAMSRDCRGLLQKSNFLQAFLTVSIPKAGGVKSAPAAHCGGGVLSLWLRLLLSLSFGEDGQQSILKVSGALERLVDLAPHRRPALLTLHNLCFCPANKTHVLANGKATSVLVSCLESKETEVRSMGASALWALLHNNQKAKTTLKSPSVRSRLEEAHALTKKEAETRQDSMNAYLLKCLENLSQLLNN